jgi:hypothetical protein
MSKMLSGMPEEAFSDDPYIRAIQEEIVAELDRRIEDGRVAKDQPMFGHEWADIERTACAIVDLKWAKKNK